MNNITVLPKDLNIDTSNSLQLYDYRNVHNILKTKINLSKNTISFLIAGTKEVIGDDKTVQIKSDNFLIMKSGNCLMTEKISNSNKFYRSILLFFSDEEALSFLEKHDLVTTKHKEKRTFYVFKYDNFLQHFVEGLEQILLLPELTQQQLLKAKFEELMLYLTYQNGTSFLNSIVQSVDDKVSRLTNIVQNNKFNKLGLDELAFLSNMSTSTFKREFFRIYQSTPMKWFNDQRLEHAAVLLKTNRLRPIELYNEAGYDSFSNFVQAFKKKFGVTPKQYQIQD